MKMDSAHLSCQNISSTHTLKIHQIDNTGSWSARLTSSEFRALVQEDRDEMDRLASGLEPWSAEGDQGEDEATGDDEEPVERGPSVTIIEEPTTPIRRGNSTANTPGSPNVTTDSTRTRTPTPTSILRGSAQNRIQVQRPTQNSLCPRLESSVKARMLSPS